MAIYQNLDFRVIGIPPQPTQAAPSRSEMVGFHALRYASAWALLAFPVCSTNADAGSCIDVSTKTSISLQGELDHVIFPGPPNFEDVQSGDIPEPAYILRLATPVCFTGDEFLQGEVLVSEVQLLLGSDPEDGMSMNLHNLIDRSVLITGRNAFGAHTGHHHAPVLLTVVDAVKSPLEGAGSALTVVRAFYLALGAGDGAEATDFVIPSKRNSGPFSATSLSRYYGALEVPLKLIDVSELTPSTYRAKYSFKTADGIFCNGSSIVTTTKMGIWNYISKIVAENGC